MTAIDAAAVEADMASRLQERINTFTATLAFHDTPPEPPQRWLIDRVIEHRTLAWIAGQPNGGKSFIAVDMACRIATGKPWDGNAVEQCRVLYVAAERFRSVRRRIAAWQQHHNTIASDLIVMRCDSKSRPNLSKGRDLDALIAVANAHDVRLIIIDTFAKVIVGLDENSNQDMSALVGNLETLKDQTNATVLVIHHKTKSNAPGLRGAGGLQGDADTVIDVRRERKPPKHIIIDDDKQADAEKVSGRRFRLISVNESAVIEPAAAPAGLPQPLIDAFEEHSDTITTGIAAAALGVSVNTAKTRLTKYEQQGHINHTGTGKASRWQRIRYNLDDDDEGI